MVSIDDITVADKPALWVYASTEIDNNSKMLFSKVDGKSPARQVVASTSFRIIITLKGINKIPSRRFAAAMLQELLNGTVQAVFKRGQLGYRQFKPCLDYVNVRLGTELTCRLVFASLGLTGDDKLIWPVPLISVSKQTWLWKAVTTLPEAAGNGRWIDWNTSTSPLVWRCKGFGICLDNTWKAAEFARHQVIWLSWWATTDRSVSQNMAFWHAWYCCLQCWSGTKTNQEGA